MYPSLNLVVVAAAAAAVVHVVVLKMSERRSKDLYVQILHNTMSVVY